MTSYDDIWKTFLTQTETDTINVPTLPEKIYDSIRLAVMNFNNKVRDNIECDDLFETLSRDLNNDELLIIAHMLRLIFLKNQLIHFTTLWQPFQKEIGLRNYSFQVNALKELLRQEEKIIDELIVNTYWDGWEE